MFNVALFYKTRISWRPVFFDKPAICNFPVGAWRFAYTLHLQKIPYEV